MIYYIIAGEILFWVLVIGGLVCRYIFNQKKLGAFLLWSTPMIDLAILCFAVLDLKNGGTATFSHSLAGIYIGISLVYGKSIIAWADNRFAYHFHNGPKPQKVRKYGKEYASDERAGWYKHALAYLIGCGLLGGMIVFIGEENSTRIFHSIRIWSIVLAIDFLISFSYTIWPKEKKET